MAPKENKLCLAYIAVSSGNAELIPSNGEEGRVREASTTGSEEATSTGKED